MMTTSLKGVAAACRSLSPPFEVVRDLFGYPFGTPGRTLSLKRQLELLQGQAFDINVILVAREGFGNADCEETQDALQFARDVFATVDLGIRALHWRQIPQALAGSYATIDSGAEAHDLTDDWSFPGNALDLFVVRVVNGADGWAANKGGPCDKEDKDDMTGAVVSLNGSAANSGNTFAHEMGHYLALEHCEDDPACTDPQNFIVSGSNSFTNITADQGKRMKTHCYVTKAC